MTDFNNSGITPDFVWRTLPILHTPVNGGKAP